MNTFWHRTWNINKLHFGQLLRFVVDGRRVFSATLLLAGWGWQPGSRGSEVEGWSDFRRRNVEGFGGGPSFGIRSWSDFDMLNLCFARVSSFSFWWPTSKEKRQSRQFQISLNQWCVRLLKGSGGKSTSNTKRVTRKTLRRRIFGACWTGDGAAFQSF